MAVDSPDVTRVVRWTGIAIIAALVLVGLSVIINALVLIFAGLLLSILLRMPAEWLARHTGLPRRLCVVLAIFVLIGIAVLLGLLIVPTITAQVRTLVREVPSVLRRLGESGWGHELLSGAGSPGAWLSRGEALMGQAKGWATTTVTVIFDMIVILFLGLYLSLEPSTYRRGLLHLIPHHARSRAEEAIDSVDYALRWWLLGKFVAIALVGLATGIGLALLGVPLALTLSMWAGLLTFIPNVGAILGLVPAVLMGLSQSPSTAAWVCVLYIGTILVESYLLTPIIERHTVSLPPALTLGVQAILAVLVGGIGLAVATPLIAAGLVLVKLFFVRDVIGDPVEVPRGSR